MQHLIAQYLFNNKQCVLPNVGTLSIINDSATTIIGEQSIAAPIAQINFTSNINHPYTDVVNFIAYHKNMAVDSAEAALHQFCGNIIGLANNESFTIDMVGTFTAIYKEINFAPATTPAFFNKAVFAERVIHPNDTHEMLVGDTNTDTAAMTAYLEDAPVKAYKWWVAAIIITVLSAAVVIWYYTNTLQHNLGGNRNTIEVTPTTQTYVQP